MDAYIDCMTRGEAETMLTVSQCIDDRIKEEQEMNSMASGLERQARRWVP